VVDDMHPVFEQALLEMGGLVGLPPPRSGGGQTVATSAAPANEAPEGEDEVWYLV